MFKIVMRSIEGFSREIFNSLYSFFCIIFFSKWKNLPKFDLSETKECLVFGNGPCLETDLKGALNIVENRDVLCVNDFARTDCFQQIKPRYYVLLDPEYWIDAIPEKKIQERDEFFSLLKKKTKWDMTLFIPYEMKNSNIILRSKFSLNSMIKVVVYNRIPINGFRFFRHSTYRNNLGMPLAQNVLVAAIFLALNIGYKKIFLMGADHSWHQQIEVGFDNLVYSREKHFYNQEGTLTPLVFYKDGKRCRFKMDEILGALSRAFRGYMLLEEYANYLGAKIYNASTKSFVDAFDRIEIKNL